MSRPWPRRRSRGHECVPAVSPSVSQPWRRCPGHGLVGVPFSVPAWPPWWCPGRGPGVPAGVRVVSRPVSRQWPRWYPCLCPGVYPPLVSRPVSRSSPRWCLGLCLCACPPPCPRPVGWPSCGASVCVCVCLGCAVDGARVCIDHLLAIRHQLPIVVPEGRVGTQREQRAAVVDASFGARVVRILGSRLMLAQLGASPVDRLKSTETRPTLAEVGQSNADKPRGKPGLHRPKLARDRPTHLAAFQ